MGSPMSSNVAKLYMEEVERKAISILTGTSPSQWFRYVGDTWVTIKTKEAEAFSEHINSVEKKPHQIYRGGHQKTNRQPFLDRAAQPEEDRSLNTDMYQKPTHTDELLFDFHHPLEQKLGEIRATEPQVTGLKIFSQTEKGKKKNTQTLREHSNPVVIPTGPSQNHHRHQQNTLEHLTKERTRSGATSLSHNWSVRET